MKDRKVKEVLSEEWSLLSVGGEGHQESVKEDKYGGIIIYSQMKMEQWDCWNCYKNGGGDK
jgi:hypothetical protein